MQNKSTATETRTTRGIRLYRDGAVSHVRGQRFSVRGCGGNTYSVDISGDIATCTCPDHQRRGGNCKHIAATYIYAAKHLPVKTPAERGPKFSPAQIEANLARMGA